ncbi:MAG: DUF4118 domain-containing protein [Candidatus Latescibacteria bacterium]|nr:DUF4118 domain-containing protein [Candidatus Latescibacterota bacterium]
MLVIMASVIGEWVHRRFEPTNLVMLYLAVVVIAATFLGRGPSIFASILSVLAFDVLFVPPRFSFTVYDTQYLMTFAGLLIVGLIISELTSRTREHAIQALQREAGALALYRLSRDLSNTLDFASVQHVIENHVAEVFQGRSVLFIREAETFHLVQGTIEITVDDNEGAVANWVVEHNQKAGWGTQVLSAARMMYLPLSSGQKTLGVLGVRFDDKEHPPTRQNIQSLETLANQSGLAIERVMLAEETRKMELLREKENLHTALLNSISHDLRTPLVAITGALSHLVGDQHLLENQAYKELIETAHEEASRLNRIVTNWLDMTRVEAGALKVSRQSCDVRDVIGVVLGQLDETLVNRPVHVKMPDGLPDVEMDFSLMMKVLINIVDNAVKYSSPDAPIEIEARIVGDQLEITVTDRGVGIPEEDLTRIFDKFYRVTRPINVAGTGLGLPICKGIIEAHHGTITAENRPGGGTILRMTLPKKDTMRHASDGN